MRATGSVVPPGGKGTTTRIGPFGQSPRLRAGDGGVAKAAAVPASRVRRRMLSRP